MRIRQFGFLANRARGKKLALCRELLDAPPTTEDAAVIAARRDAHHASPSDYGSSGPQTRRALSRSPETSASVRNNPASERFRGAGRR
jgi:hypothetical protein